MSETKTKERESRSGPFRSVSDVLGWCLENLEREVSNASMAEVMLQVMPRDGKDPFREGAPDEVYEKLEWLHRIWENPDQQRRHITEAIRLIRETQVELRVQEATKGAAEALDRRRPDKSDGPPSGWKPSYPGDESWRGKGYNPGSGYDG